MFPTLFQLGPITLHTYGLMIVIGFLIANRVMRDLAEPEGIDPEHISQLAMWCLIVGIVACRVLFVFTQLDYFIARPLEVFAIWKGGLVFYGGPIGVLPFFWYYAKKHGLPIWRTADILMIGVALNHSFGRLGCLAAGCCYGRPTDHWWGIKLHSELVDASLRGVPLHPTQIYESLAVFLMFLGLRQLFLNRRFDGQVFLAYGLVYPIIRSLIEVYRGDIVRGFVVQGWLSTSQFISILVFIATAIAMIWRVRLSPEPIAAGAGGGGRKKKSKRKVA